MSQRKRFSFDDEVDDTIDLSKDDLKNSSITNNDKPSNDNVFADEDGLDAKAYPTDNGGDKSMKNKKKRKFKIKNCINCFSINNYCVRHLCICCWRK